MKCNICAGEIKPDPNGWDKGHNPWPLEFIDGPTEQKCCGECNTVVIKRRLNDHINRNKEEKSNNVNASTI